MKREELQALGITDAELVSKIMDLNGADIEKQKNQTTAVIAERDDLKARLEEASSKLEGFDPEWKSKAEAARAEAEQKVQQMKYEMLTSQAVNDLKFSSQSAKKAFLNELNQKKLPIDNDKLLGYQDFVKQYQESDPDAFVSEDAAPVITKPTPGPTKSGVSTADAANTALRELFQRKG